MHVGRSGLQLQNAILFILCMHIAQSRMMKCCNLHSVFNFLWSILAVVLVRLALTRGHRIVLKGEGYMKRDNRSCWQKYSTVLAVELDPFEYRGWEQSSSVNCSELRNMNRLVGSCGPLHHPQASTLNLLIHPKHQHCPLLASQGLELSRGPARTFHLLQGKVPTASMAEPFHNPSVLPLPTRAWHHRSHHQEEETILSTWKRVL